MYKLRISLAILGWNEHIDRQATSLKDAVCCTNPRRRSAKRVLTAKKKYICG